jgi:hypothetical protein
MVNHPYKRRGPLGTRKPGMTGLNEHGPDMQITDVCGHHDEATSPDSERRVEYERHETPRPDWKTPRQPPAAERPVVVTRKRRWSGPELPDSGNDKG